MKIGEATEGSVTIVAPEGAIDIDNFHILKDKLYGLIDTDRTDILVDLSAVHFITSTGLGVLVLCAKRLQKADGRLALCSLDENITRLFDTVGFTEFFEIYPDAAAALAKMT